MTIDTISGSEEITVPVIELVARIRMLINRCVEDRLYFDGGISSATSSLPPGLGVDVVIDSVSSSESIGQWSGNGTKLVEGDDGFYEKALKKYLTGAVESQVSSSVRPTVIE